MSKYQNDNKNITKKTVTENVVVCTENTRDGLSTLTSNVTRKSTS